MAKILVADDNSNIQKMVGLALKDQGIDVVAVGNGEAAVRKISDVRPDLVLADVFMPVRNGYEVCKYVKDDAGLAHIPVILLVGAFDPLDEEEAQRVGADGVLKKPFVPPDPLISMVKSALARVSAAAAESAANANASNGAASGTAKHDSAANVPVLSALPQTEAPAAVEPEIPTMNAATQMPTSLPAFKLPSSPVSQPEPEQDEDNAAMVSTTEGAHFGAERDWRSAAGDEEEEEAAPAKSSWRRDAGDDESSAEEGLPAKARDWRESLVEPPAGMAGTTESEEEWTPTREKQALVDFPDEQPETKPDTKSVPVAGLGNATAPFAGDAWAAAMEAGTQEKQVKTEAAAAPDPDETIVESATLLSVKPLETLAVPEPLAADNFLREQTSAPVETSAERQDQAKPFEPERTAESWFSNAPSPWESEARKATQLAATWGAPTPAEPKQEERVEFPSNGAASAETEDAPLEMPVSALETEKSSEAQVSPEPMGSAYSGEQEIFATQRVEEAASTSSAYGDEDLQGQELGATAPMDTEPEVKVQIEAASAEISVSAVETIREEVAEIVGEPHVVSEELASFTKGSLEAPESAEMNAVVAKVLANLSPEVLQAITREILKPVVEAIVRDELKAKKP